MACLKPPPRQPPIPELPLTFDLLFAWTSSLQFRAARLRPLQKTQSMQTDAPLPIRARGPYKSHVGASSGGPKHHDVVRLRAPSLHAGRADRHPRNGKPDCAWPVVEEPFERDGGNVALDDIAPDLRCVAGRQIVGYAESRLYGF